MKRIAKRRRRFVLFVLLAMLLALNFCPVAASEGEQDADLAGNIEEILSELDTEELQKYLDSLTVEQRELFGANIADAIRSVISGDF